MNPDPDITVRTSARQIPKVGAAIKWPRVSPTPPGISLLLFGLAVCAFLPCLQNDFITFDDGLYITGNIHVQTGFTWKNIVWAFSSLKGGIWHPLTWLSIMLDCQLFGLRPGGHHFTGVLLHAANTALLFVLFWRMTGTTWRSAMVAVLFALHPLHVESVAWASERKDLLSTLFALLGLLMYVRYAQKLSGIDHQGSGAENPATRSLDTRHSRLDYSLALFFFICGLMSKSMVVTLPVIFLLLDFWPLRRLQSQSGFPNPNSFLPLLWEKLPFVAAAAVSSLITMHSQQVLGALVTTNELPFANRIANGILSYGFYLKKMVWPNDLAIFYPYPKVFLIWGVLGVAVLLLSISVIAVLWSGRRPFLAVGWFWYLVTLLPVIGFIQVGSQSQADRYVYVPLIGIFLILVWGAYDLTARWRFQGVLLSAAGAAVTFLCFGLTHRQISFWRDSETLFRHALAVTADNRPAHDNLGTALLRKGRGEEAISHFREAMRLKPGDPEELNNLGFVLLNHGQVDEAVTNLQWAARLKPDYATPHYGLGLALGQQGRLVEAISEFRQALRLRPDYADALCGLGIALIRMDRPDEAVAPLEQAVRLNPVSAEAHCNLGNVLAAKGRLDEGIKHLREATALKPGYADAHHSLGVMLGMNGRLDEAIMQFQEAISLNPENPENHCSLGIGLARQHRLEDAISQFEEALRLNPNLAEAHCNLGAALATKGRLDEAINHLQTAIALKPGYPAAENNLRGALAAKAALRPPAETTTKP